MLKELQEEIQTLGAEMINLTMNVKHFKMELL